MGKTVFTFGAQKKGGDFYVDCDGIKAHSQLTVQPKGRISIGFCNPQVTPFHIPSFLYCVLFKQTQQPCPNAIPC